MPEKDTVTITKADVGAIPSRIVAGVGSAAICRDASLAKRIETAMAAAIRDGMAHNVPLDSPEMKQRMLAARDAIKAGK